MKQWILAFTCIALLGGCAAFQKDKKPAKQPVAVKKAYETPLVDANGAPIERVPFRAGVSSVTVENMAKQRGCVGGQGAGLMTEPGPIEIYRMVCENGQVFRARCEMRQCKAM
ncbi:MAG: hypothetical protein ACLGI6_01000 [Gammaproteobacteria bacterium]